MPHNAVIVPALIGTNPLGALAAFGLLRILSHRHEDVRLSFTLLDDWVVAIHSESFKDLDEIISCCVEWIAGRNIEEIGWADDVRVESQDFRQQLQNLLVCDPGSDIERFYYALAAEGVEDKSKGLVKPGPLYMVSGQQSFLAGLKEIHAAVRNKPRELFEEALQGPWRYQTRAHHLGWDPAGERLHALRHRSPTSEKPSCVAAATWLAYEAMALLPTFAARGRVGASGFDYHNRRYHFTWPIISAPISLEALRSLLQTRTFSNRDGSFRAGIADVYASERYEFGQGYGVFRPAKPWRDKQKTPHVVS